MVVLLEWGIELAESSVEVEDDGFWFVHKLENYQLRLMFEFFEGLREARFAYVRISSRKSSWDREVSVCLKD